MSILTFEQFAINEDTTSNLIQQKNTLAQEINDKQKKLLDIQAQIVNAQKQTLAQNPQAQIPMQENEEHTDIPSNAEIVNADFYFPGKYRSQGELYVNYAIPGSEDVEVQADVDDFEDFLEDKIKEMYDEDDIDQYVETEENEDGRYRYMNLERFWDETPAGEKVALIKAYLASKKSLQ